jgi:hypothetical protein
MEMQCKSTICSATKGTIAYEEKAKLVADDDAADAGDDDDEVEVS